MLILAINDIDRSIKAVSSWNDNGWQFVGVDPQKQNCKPISTLKKIVENNLNTNHLQTHPQQRIEESLNITDHNEIIVTSIIF